MSFPQNPSQLYTVASDPQSQREVQTKEVETLPKFLKFAGFGNKRPKTNNWKIVFTDLGSKILSSNNNKKKVTQKKRHRKYYSEPPLRQQEMVLYDQPGNPSEDMLLKEHIIFMVNGLFGNANNWLVVEEKLIKHLDSLTTVLHRSEANQFTQTFDGVEICGERLCDEMKVVASKYPNLQRISLIGHSMGGLFLRFAIGKLFDPVTETILGLQPCHFITMVTPHLGSDAEGPAQVPFLSWPGMVPGVGNQLHSVFSYFASPVTQRMYRRSGLQLFLDDDLNDPILLRMTRDLPDEDIYFWSALSSFRTRTCFANAGSDHIVGWPNASIRDLDELPKIDFSAQTCKGVVREDPIEFAFTFQERQKVKDLASELNLDEQYDQFSNIQQQQRQQSDEKECQDPVESNVGSPQSFYSAASFMDFMEGKWQTLDGDVFNGQFPEEIQRVGSPLGLQEVELQFQAIEGDDTTIPLLEAQHEQDEHQQSQSHQGQLQNSSQDGEYTGRFKIKSKETQYFQSSAERMEKSIKILNQLKQLSWRRVDVSFRDARMKFFSHQLIQVTRRWINWEGEGVPEYLAMQIKKMEELIWALK